VTVYLRPALLSRTSNTLTNRADLRISKHTYSNLPDAIAPIAALHAVERPAMRAVPPLLQEASAMFRIAQRLLVRCRCNGLCLAGCSLLSVNACYLGLPNGGPREMGNKMVDRPLLVDLARYSPGRREVLAGAAPALLSAFVRSAKAAGTLMGADGRRGGESSTVGSLLNSSHMDSSNDSRDASLLWQNAGLLSRGGIPNRTTIYTTLTPIGNGQDDARHINTAIGNCPAGQVVLLGPGTFTILPGSYVLLWKDNITLRGSGAGVTTILRNPGAVRGSQNWTSNPSPCVIVSKARYGLGTSRGTNLTADAPSGSTSITVANATGFAVGAPILIDEASGAGWQHNRVWGDHNTASPGPFPNVWASPDYRVVWRKNNPYYRYVDDFDANTYPTTPGSAGQWFCRLDRPTSEIKLVTAINGNTITFDTPLTMTYRVRNTAQACYYHGLGTNLRTIVTNTGVESMTLSSGDNETLHMQCAMYCWAKDVEVVNSLDSGISMTFCFRCEIEGCYIHDCAWPVPGGAGYNISLAWGCSEILIHNNISVRANKVMVARCCGAGSVVAYNYMDMGYINYNVLFVEIGINASHMVGGHHVLFEGNWCFNMDSDNTHGNSIYMTGFRNHLTGYRSDFTSVGGQFQSDTSTPAGGGAHGPFRCAGGLAYSCWFSFIGNVLGTPGLTTPAHNWVYIRRLGLGMAGWGWNTIFELGTEMVAPYGYDPGMAPTTIINGNYDYVQNQQTWDRNGPQTLPKSFFLTQAPAYFQGLPWPWVDPSTGTTHTLPAKARYDSGNPINGRHTHLPSKS
jgi:hypothetical protein